MYWSGCTVAPIVEFSHRSVFSSRVLVADIQEPISGSLAREASRCLAPIPKFRQPLSLLVLHEFLEVRTQLAPNSIT